MGRSKKGAQKQPSKNEKDVPKSNTVDPRAPLSEFYQQKRRPPPKSGPDSVVGERANTDSTWTEGEANKGRGDAEEAANSANPSPLPLPPRPSDTLKGLPHFAANTPGGTAISGARDSEMGSGNKADDLRGRGYESRLSVGETGTAEGMSSDANPVKALFSDNRDIPTGDALFGGDGPLIPNLPVSATPSAMQTFRNPVLDGDGKMPATMPGLIPASQVMGSYPGMGQGVATGAAHQCSSRQCIHTNNRLKNEVNKLMAELDHSKDAQRNANKVRDMSEEALRLANLKIDSLNARLSAIQEEHTKLKRKRSENVKEDSDEKAKKRARRTSKSNKKSAERGVIIASSAQLGELSTSAITELTAMERLFPHGGFIISIGRVILDSVTTRVVQDTVRCCAECLVEPWNEDILYGPVLGFYPRHIKALSWDEMSNPDSLVCALPPEPVTAGLGSASMGYTAGEIPILPTKLFLSDRDVGAVDMSIVKGPDNRTLVGYQLRTVVETCIYYKTDSHSWNGFSPEFDEKGMRKLADSEHGSALGTRRIMHRAIRNVFAGDAIDADELKAAAQKWKDEKMTLTRDNAEKKSGVKDASDLGLTPGADLTEKDLNIFNEGISQALASCSYLGSYISKSAMNWHSNRRMRLQTGFFEDIGVFENDVRLGDPKFYKQRDPRAREGRYEFLCGNPEKNIQPNDTIRKQYEELAMEITGLNCGNVVIGSKNKTSRKMYSAATTFTQWKGSGSGTSNGWRRHTNKTCKAFKNLTSGASRGYFGYEDGVDSMQEDELLTEKYWEGNLALPTLHNKSSPGPVVDELFANKESRLRMIDFMQRSPVLINVKAKLSDFNDLWAITETDLTAKEIGVVRRIVGDNSLRWIVIADTEIAVGLHGRFCELLYGFKMSPAQHGLLFRSLLVPFCLNLSQELWDICMKIPSFRNIEVKLPFDYSRAQAWKLQRLNAKKSFELLPRDGEEEISAELSSTREDFEAKVTQILPISLHGCSYYMEEARNLTYAYWSYTDKVDYLVLTPEFFASYICSWFGIVRDAHVGFYDPKQTFSGQFSPLSLKYKHIPAYNIHHSNLNLIEDGSKKEEIQTVANIPQGERRCESHANAQGASAGDAEEGNTAVGKAGADDAVTSGVRQDPPQAVDGQDMELCQDGSSKLDPQPEPIDGGVTQDTTSQQKSVPPKKNFLKRPPRSMFDGEEDHPFREESSDEKKNESGAESQDDEDMKGLLTGRTDPRSPLRRSPRKFSQPAERSLQSQPPVPVNGPEMHTPRRSPRKIPQPSAPSEPEGTVSEPRMDTPRRSPRKFSQPAERSLQIQPPVPVNGPGMHTPRRSPRKIPQPSAPSEPEATVSEPRMDTPRRSPRKSSKPAAKRKSQFEVAVPDPSTAGGAEKRKSSRLNNNEVETQESGAENSTAGAKEGAPLAKRSSDRVRKRSSRLG